MSYSFTTTATFTRTHAKHLAAKVIADLYQCSVLYDRPSPDSIDDYQTELIELLAHEYVERYEFGFKADDKRVLTFRYKIGADGGMHGDGNAGGVYAKAIVAGASYYNMVTTSTKWGLLNPAQRTSFESGLPFQRPDGSLPADGDGYWQSDHGYNAGGVRVTRETFRPR
ncbi:MAG: HORMA-1 domain-containing protein [Acidimicrobiia bacterium]